jgi:putative transposase
VDDHADRAPQSWRRGRVYRVWRRLKGLPDAIRATWPDATVQTCVVHLVGNSSRDASKKHWAQINRELPEIYTAPTVEAAEVCFGEFAQTWRETYPAMVSW